MKYFVPRRVVWQKGFTLLELLIALVLTSVILVSVQRYIAGVTTDYEGVVTRHDQATQSYITLINMQRDVAQAGFFPYASAQNPESSLPLGVFVTYEGDQLHLSVSSYQPKANATDCNGHRAQYERLFQEWVYVQNIYAITKDARGAALSCNGNGGDVGYKDALDNVEDFSVTDEDGAVPDASTAMSMISVCIVTQERKPSIGGATTTTMCDNTSPTPQGTDAVYYKMRVDMPVFAQQFQAGS